MSRKLATIRRIDEIRPIPNADSIEAARVGGWWVVVKAGEFTVNSGCVFIEVDSWVPSELAPFLTKPGIPEREYNGVKGERLRSIRLRGTLSQGLILPIYDFPPTKAAAVKLEANGFVYDQSNLIDVTEELGIQKWERAAEYVGSNPRGNFPSVLRKTDQERIQNIRVLPDGLWVVEEKLDGSSMTVANIIMDEATVEQHVCSRNLSLSFKDSDDTFSRTAKDTNILEALSKYGKSIALSGELIGPGIQGNRYGLTKHEWRIFDVYDISASKYLTYTDRQNVIYDLVTLGAMLVQVPRIRTRVLDGVSHSQILLDAEGKSILNPKAEREGLVFKLLDDGDVSFKAISNAFLMKHEN